MDGERGSEPKVGAKPPPAAAGAPALKKDRHIVSWTPQEDQILREQISINGTDSWTSIAARFKDKTARQCRRRWYTYLNSECKKGGWSAEEDMVLCEAQKLFGNRWTEIAKVVSGRTDNAVKNRFSTLCKKQAKLEALSKENRGPCINTNNKRIINGNRCITAGICESSAPLKQPRYQIPVITEDHCSKEKLLGRQRMEEQQFRRPLAILAQNFENIDAANLHHLDNKPKSSACDVSDKIQGTFLKRDDPKLIALLQQAELLSSLAAKVNSENTKQSLEDAWKELQDYLIQTEESGMSGKISGTDLLNDFRDLMEDLRSGGIGDHPLERQSDIREDSSGSTEYSTESTNPLNAVASKKQLCQAEECSSNRSLEVDACHKEGLSPSLSAGLERVVSAEENGANVHNLTIPDSEVGSPLQTIPLFQSFTEGPSPKFSASERNFLLSVLGVSSPCPCANSQPPLCKRSLLNSL